MVIGGTHMNSLIKKIFLLFLSCALVSCSRYRNLKAINFDIHPSQSYAKDFYDSNKKEFLVFDNNSSFLEYFESNNYIIGNDFCEQQKNILTDKFYEEFYITMLNIVIGTSEEIIVEQKNNLIVYHIDSPKTATDGLVLKTVFNKVSKMDYKIGDFSFEVK